MYKYRHDDKTIVSGHFTGPNAPIYARFTEASTRASIELVEQANLGRQMVGIFDVFERQEESLENVQGLLNECAAVLSAYQSAVDKARREASVEDAANNGWGVPERVKCELAFVEYVNKHNPIKGDRDFEGCANIDDYDAFRAGWVAARGGGE